jgi:hypothetical protein
MLSELLELGLSARPVTSGDRFEPSRSKIENSDAQQLSELPRLITHTSVLSPGDKH